MKTISAYFNINNHGHNQLITTKKSYRNHKYYDQSAGDINRNATISQLEYQRDACEEELYRLRYGIEKLLANNEQGDFKVRQRQKFGHVQNSFRTMTNRITDFNNRENRNSIDQCSPCCRHGRRNKFEDNIDVPNEYAYHHHRVYNDRNYDSSLRRTPKSPRQSQLYSDPFVSTSPSPSISPHYINPNINHPKNDLRQSIDNLINRNTSNKTDILNLLKSKELNDPVYNSLILKILEAKALDCLCTGYSKQNTQKQISQALAEINQRVDEHQWDSISVTPSRSLPASYESSSRSLPASYESPSTVSSILTNDESISSQSITSQLYSPLPSAIQTSNLDQRTPTMVSPVNNKDNIKSSLKLPEDIKTPKKQSKVTILADKTSRTSKSKKKKKPSSKHQNKSTKAPKKSSKKHSSSKSKKKKVSSKSPSKSKSSKKPKSKHKKSSKKKSTKPKSNNQVNDHEAVILPTFIYPQPYQEVYRNRQKLSLSST